ncbi:Alpha-ketoglutarate-dependent dioxygenase alkB-like protein [Drosera capensis]
MQREKRNRKGDDLRHGRRCGDDEVDSRAGRGGRDTIRNPNSTIVSDHSPSPPSSKYQMYGGGDDGSPEERTAFRRAEKRYKLYYQHASKKKKKQEKPVDLSGVVDFDSILKSFIVTGDTPDGFYAVDGSFDRPVFGLQSRPGFYFIPGALSVEEQCHWIKESLTSFPQPPNRTNHNAFYGPIYNLFAAAKERKILVEDGSSQASPTESDYVSTVSAHRWKFCCGTATSLNGRSRRSILASVLLRKLRWSTLGLQFDWSKRSYNVSLPHKKIPNALCQLAKKMAAPAMLTGEEFRPEAAIVNYFALGDALGGHLDDMEADWSKPIVSISLGCKAIFLLGGRSREDEHIAMFLRSGDIVLMAGEARECFHGVPRIFTDKLHSEIAPIEEHLLNDEEDSCFLEYIRTSRININIRQVF